MFDNCLWSLFRRYSCSLKFGSLNSKRREFPQGICFDAEDDFLAAESGLDVGVVGRVERNGYFLGQMDCYAIINLQPFIALMVQLRVDQKLVPMSERNHQRDAV